MNSKRSVMNIQSVGALFILGTKWRNFIENLTLPRKTTFLCTIDIWNGKYAGSTSEIYN